MQITALKAENILPLKAVEVQVEGMKMIEVTSNGKNAQGKSSLLDCIAAALCGKALDKTEMIRRGESTGSITLTLDEIIVEITYNLSPAGEQVRKLRVIGKEGVPVGSPQAYLDKLGAAVVAADPLAMARLASGSPADRRNLMNQVLQVVDLGTFSPEDNAAQSKAIFDQRTDVNREAKRVESEVEGMVKSAGGMAALLSAPDAPLDIASLSASYQAAVNATNERKNMSAKSAALADEIDLKRQHVAALQKEIDRMQEERDGLNRVLDMPLAVADQSVLLEQLQGVEQTNALVRSRVQWEKLSETLTALNEKSANLTRQIEGLATEKAAALSSAGMPVPGLAFDFEAGELKYNNLPLSQASSAEQIRVCLGLLIARNPELKILRVHEGSLLGPEMLAEIERAVRNSDFQLWIENVNPSGQGDVSLVIEDGNLVGVEEGTF